MTEILFFLLGICVLTVTVGVTICIVFSTINFVKETINEWREEDGR